MKMKKKSNLTSLVLVALVVLSTSKLSGQDSPARKIARGKYLVEGVAGCAYCHTPRTDRGEPDRTRWLQGATLDFQPIHPIPIWAPVAPPLAALPGWSEADAIKLLETGISRTGKPARPPMPPYRMTREDAAAVVAYLKSLQPAAKVR